MINISKIENFELNVNGTKLNLSWMDAKILHEKLGEYLFTSIPKLLRYEETISTAPNQNIDICKECGSNPNNGGNGICNCTLPYLNNTKY